MSNTALATMPSTGNSIGSYLGNENVKAGIAKVVNEKNMDRFVTSIVSAVQANPLLATCTNQSIVSAALMGESLQLAPSPQLGYFYFVPYRNKKKIGGRDVEVQEAQFQLGWKGMVQLAIRSGQYKNIVCNVIKEGEIDYNPITEEIDLHPIKDPAAREKARTIGYYAAFELVSGFKKQMFTPIEAMQAHAREWSKAYKADLKYKTSRSPWTSNFDAMAKKTMIRMLLGKWGIMSVEMQQAYVNDMAVIDEDGTARYVDSQPQTIDAQVREDIDENANTVDFDEDAVEAEIPINSPTPEAIAAAAAMPETPKRGRPKKAEVKPAPAPTPAPVPVVEAEVSAVDDEPEWM